MRIFVAGATGTLGRPVVKRLVAAGHTVTGLTRSRDRARSIEAIGARAVVGDALDADTLRQIVIEDRPEVVVHLLTALPAAVLRPSHLRATNRIRTEGTANLLRAAIDAGAKRIVAESFVGIYGAAPPAHVITEDEPLPPATPGPFVEALTAVRDMEAQLLRARARIETVSLRIGYFYGPGVPSTDGMIDQARRGRLFKPAGADGIGPFVHIDDAAAGVVSAIEHRAPSAVYNVVDDEPIGLVNFLELMTKTVGAPPPRPLPAWLVRLMAPVMAAFATTKLRLSNAKAKRELGWSPRYPTVRDGIVTLTSRSAEAA